MSAAFKDFLLSDRALEGPFAGAARALRAVDAAPASLRSAGPSRKTVQGSSWATEEAPRVLVVEPDESARTAMQLVLSKEGFEVTAVSSAFEAQRLLSPGRLLPHAVVIEAELRGSDGFSLCGQLRADQRTASLTVLMLSRRGGPEFAEMASGVGADDFLAKPVFVRDVSALLKVKLSERTLDGGARLETATTPLPRVLRALLAGIRSGHVELGKRGRLAFRQGQVVDASFDGKQGEEALLRALLFTEGEYTIYVCPSLGRASFSYPLSRLVREALPRVARWEQLSLHGVPLEARLGVDFRSLGAALSSLPDVVNEVVRLFDGHRTVRQVVSESPLDEVRTLEVATRLYAMGVVTPADKPSELPANAPALFEPAPREADERLKGLFGDQAPPRPEWREVDEIAAGIQLAAAQLKALELARSSAEAFEIEVVEPPVRTEEEREIDAFLGGIDLDDASIEDVLLPPPILLTEEYRPSPDAPATLRPVPR